MDATIGYNKYGELNLYQNSIYINFNEFISKLKLRYMLQ